MERIWLAHYPPGVAAEIDPSRYTSLVAMLDESFATYKDDQAFVCMDKAITYGELEAKSRALGAYLQGKGLKRGARIAIMMPNVLQYPVAIAAAMRAGFTVVNVNPLYTPRELEFQLKDSGAEAIVVLENFAHTLEHAIGQTDVKHVIVASMGDMLGTLKGALVNLVVRKVKKMVPAFSLPGSVAFNDAVAAGQPLKLTTPALGPDDIAFLQYTGGTTGVAKGAVLTHRNLIANCLQVEAWMPPSVEPKPEGERTTIIVALPLYHIFALTACFLIGVRIGGLCVLIPNPRDLPNLIKEMVTHKPTIFPAVNTLFNGMLNHPDFGKIDWSRLTCAIGGGMAVQKAVAEKWFKATGTPIIEGYGLSETSPLLTCNRSDITEWSGTIGLPVPSTEISIRDADDKEVPLGQPGEICARGPQVMAGYWGRPDETAKSMSPDGFFRTGDIGVMDTGGRIKIVDRKKDMLLVSGFNVYPNEVEDVIASHPGVLECAVIGVRNSNSGESVKAFVVKKDPNLTEADLLAHCKEQLTHYKLPRNIEFRTELPKSNVGKILRRALRDEMESAAAAA
jgi:long-chain acyl-CoA synthetase